MAKISRFANSSLAGQRYQSFFLSCLLINNERHATLEKAQSQFIILHSLMFLSDNVLIFKFLFEKLRLKQFNSSLQLCAKSNAIITEGKMGALKPPRCYFKLVDTAR